MPPKPIQQKPVYAQEDRYIVVHPRDGVYLGPPDNWTTRMDPETGKPDPSPMAAVVKYAPTFTKGYDLSQYPAGCKLVKIKPDIPGGAVSKKSLNKQGYKWA